MNDDANEIVAKYRVNNNKITSKSFEYKTNRTGKTPAIASRLDTKFVVPLKYLKNFWRSLNLPLINCEMELDISWSKDCAISEISRTSEVPANPAVDLPTEINK